MIRLFASLLLISLFSLSTGQAVWIYGKANLAEYLIADAWQQTLSRGGNNKPWRWADTWPVAKLVHPSSGTEVYVLEGADGSSLAFGAGHLHGTATPGFGASVIGGHRDTHFRFFRDARLKDELLLQDRNGDWRSYTIATMQVRNIRTQPLMIDKQGQALYLVTCYPFTALTPGGPLRYLIVAEPDINTGTNALAQRRRLTQKQMPPIRAPSEV